jgi:CRP-like cAMP-binding protein
MDLLPRYSDDHLFKYLTPYERRYIIEHTPTRTLAAEEILIRHGEQDDTMFRVESGSLEVYAETGEGAVLLATVVTGDILGEMAFLTSQPRSATIKAVEPAVVRELRRSDLNNIIRDAPEIVGKIALAIGERVAARLAATLDLLPTLTQDAEQAVEARLRIEEDMRTYLVRTVKYF